jgi:hypothetical protein
MRSKTTAPMLLTEKANEWATDAPKSIVDFSGGLAVPSVR